MPNLLLGVGSYHPRQFGLKYDIFDASIPGSLFQDSALTTPVVAKNDPIGGAVNFGNGGSNWAASGSTRPFYDTSSINSLPTAKTDGSDDRIDLAGPSGISITTLVMTFKTGTLSGGPFFFVDRPDGSYGHAVFTGASGGVWHIYAGNDVSGGTVASNTVYTITAIMGSSNGLLRVNGTEVINANAGSNTQTGFRFGTDNAGGAPAPGKLLRCVRWHGLLTSSQYALEEYLQRKLGAAW